MQHFITTERYHLFEVWSLLVDGHCRTAPTLL
jgi:hypothetical protein